MPKKVKPQQTDEPAQTIEHIVRESGVTDESLTARLVRGLLPFWVKSTADAQVRGFRIRQKVDQEKETET